MYFLWLVSRTNPGGSSEGGHQETREVFLLERCSLTDCEVLQARPLRGICPRFVEQIRRPLDCAELAILCIWQSSIQSDPSRRWSCLNCPAPVRIAAGDLKILESVLRFAPCSSALTRLTNQEGNGGILRLFGLIACPR